MREKGKQRQSYRTISIIVYINIYFSLVSKVLRNKFSRIKMLFILFLELGYPAMLSIRRRLPEDEFVDDLFFLLSISLGQCIFVSVDM